MWYRRFRVVLVCALVMCVTVVYSADAFAGQYPFSAKFEHLVYSQQTFSTYGGYPSFNVNQQPVNSSSVGVRYSLVYKASDPLYDTILVSKDIYGTGQKSFSMGMVNASNYWFRLLNLNYNPGCIFLCPGAQVGGVFNY